MGSSVMYKMLIDFWIKGLTAFFYGCWGSEEELAQSLENILVFFIFFHVILVYFLKTVED